MKKLYETAMINHGGREGEVAAPNGSMQMKITPPGMLKEQIRNNYLLRAMPHVSMVHCNI